MTDELDVRELACPGPVLKLRDLLDAGEASVRLWVADALCRSNVERFAASRGAVVEVAPAAAGTFHLTIRAADQDPVKGPDHDPAPACELPEPAPDPGGRRGPIVVQVSASTMGTGDDELGALLLRGFLKTQSQLDRRPDRIVFYNGGVKLCCSGSLVIEDLRDLEVAGTEVLACGTCLNFYDLADRLDVGRVTDMLEIATTLSEAATIIRP